MPRNPRVYVKVAFVSTKAGRLSAPPVIIESPVDLSELVGGIMSKDFRILKDRLESVVEDTEKGLSFHKHSHHEHAFDESSPQNGAICGLKQRRKSDLASKTTAG